MQIIRKTLIVALMTLHSICVAEELENEIELLAKASIITPGNLILTNQTFRVPHSASLSGMPSLGIGVSIPLGQMGGFTFTTETQLSYRYKSGPLTVQNAQGESVEDTLTLHWIPLGFSTKVAYEIPGFSYAKPSLAFGAGTQWLSQRGKLLGITQSFWVPFVFISPALTFLEGQTTKDWFGGFSFGTTLYRAFNTNQTVEGLTVDLSVNFLL